MLNACATSPSVAPGNQAAQYEETIRSEQEQNYNILRGILKMHSDFRETTGNAEIKLQFDFNDENFSVLRAKYGLDAIAGNGDNLSKSLNILFWLSEHTYHDGMFDNDVPKNALDLLEYAYDRGEAGRLNCLNLAYILSECLLSIGVPGTRAPMLVKSVT